MTPPAHCLLTSTHNIHATHGGQDSLHSALISFHSLFRHGPKFWKRSYISCLRMSAQTLEFLKVSPKRLTSFSIVPPECLSTHCSDGAMVATLLYLVRRAVTAADRQLRGASPPPMEKLLAAVHLLASCVGSVHSWCFIDMFLNRGLFLPSGLFCFGLSSVLSTLRACTAFQSPTF